MLMNMKLKTETRLPDTSARLLSKTTQLAERLWKDHHVFVIPLTLGIAILGTMSRGYRAPGTYGMLQWLLNYDTGFTSRGLIGTVMAPLFSYKSFDEILEIIEVVSVTTLLTLLLLTLVSARRIMAYAKTSRDEALFFSILMVFATSVFWTMSAHTNGFFDHFLELITIAGIFAVRTQRHYLLSILSIVAIAIHEMFAIYGLPAFIFAVLLHHRTMGGSPLYRKLLISFLPTVLFTLFYFTGQLSSSPEKVEAVKAQVQSVADAPLVKRNLNAVTYHLSHSLAEKAAAQRHNAFIKRLTDPEINRMVTPVVILITLIFSIILLRGGMWPYIPLALAVCLSPNIIHLFAWDTERFAAFQIFNGFVVLFCVALFAAPMPFGKSAWIIVGLSGLLVWNNLAGAYPLMGQHVDGQGILSLRHEPFLDASFFKTCEKVFRNADFEQKSFDDWSVSHGNGFGRNPQKTRLKGNTKRWFGIQGYYYVTTKKHHRGRLTSKPFKIDGDAIAFLIGGTRDKKKTYAVLTINGKRRRGATGDNHERGRLSPHLWWVKKYRGKEATISIVDKDPSADRFISADSFCYYPSP